MAKLTRQDGREITVEKSNVFGIRPSRTNRKRTMIVYKNANYVTVLEDIAIVEKRLRWRSR